MSPNKEKHGSYIIIEPTTGIIREYVLRFQLNVYMKYTRTLIPLAWIEIAYSLEDSDQRLLDFLHFMLSYAKWILIGLSIITVICLAVPLFFIVYKAKIRRPTVDGNEEESPINIKVLE